MNKQRLLSKTNLWVFRSTALPLVESFLQGHNGLLFAYGITNAGKTYTITGKTNDTEEKGILPRMLDVIFNSINPQENQIKNGDGVVAKVPMDPNMTHWIWLTYYEIYNDKIIGILVLCLCHSLFIIIYLFWSCQDLLNVANQKKLPLKLKDENGKYVLTFLFIFLYQFFYYFYFYIHLFPSISPNPLSGQEERSTK